jgi:enoyl-CoA hydratase
MESATYTTLALSVDNGIGQIILNRPDKLNSMSPAFWQELPLAMAALAEYDDVRVVVLSAQGKHFSAGMDLAVFQTMASEFHSDPARRAEQLRRLVKELQQCFQLFDNARVPILAAVQGGVIGGALDMICACDCRYATEDAFFTIKETAIGMTADLGTLQHLPRLIPEGLAKELAYTGRHLSAEEAKTCGLVNAVFTTVDEMMSHVLGIAKTIASLSPVAVTGSKQVINYSREHSLADSLDYMATWQSGLFHLAEIEQTLQAQQHKAVAKYAPLASSSSLMAAMTAKIDPSKN